MMRKPYENVYFIIQLSGRSITMQASNGRKGGEKTIYFADDVSLQEELTRTLMHASMMGFGLVKEWSDDEGN